MKTETPYQAELLAVQADPEAVRLVQLFTDAERLASQIMAYQEDHPPTCTCRVCKWLKRFSENNGPPFTADFLTCISTTIWSASPCYSELPSYPGDTGTATG